MANANATKRARRTYEVQRYTRRGVETVSTHTRRRDAEKAARKYSPWFGSAWVAESSAL